MSQDLKQISILLDTVFYFISFSGGDSENYIMIWSFRDGMYCHKAGGELGGEHVRAAPRHLLPGDQVHQGLPEEGGA